MSQLPPLIYEDEALLAFDKPSGLLVTPDRWDKTAVNLSDLVHEKLSPDYFNVHRIDKDTSGLVLFAKDKRSLDLLSGQFQGRTVEKKYVALILGGPVEDEGEVKRPITENTMVPGRMKTVRKEGKPAVTRYRVLKRWKGYSLLEIRPETGRTHQIRVHLQYLKCPVLADPMYGDGKGFYLSSIKKKYKNRDEERPLLDRLALHAEELTLKHPLSGKPMTLTAPLPKIFSVVIRYLDRFA